MPTNEFSQYMDQIVGQISEFLKPHGFKKRNRTFNRWTQDGLCQVFNLQMGIRSLYGEFTANLGIFIPEVYRDMMNEEPPNFINEYECAIRARFGEFTQTEDKWWEIAPYSSSIVEELIDLLQTYGLPFFIRFPDRQSIIDHLLSFNEKYHVSNSPKLDIALILENLGKHEDAIKMFNQHYRDSTNNKAHIEIVEKIAEKHNWKFQYYGDNKAHIEYLEKIAEKHNWSIQ
ncbi:MAG: hypothetical protein A2Z15_03390 [Chloroflexi bacterium RBG_16_50_11]|nr:MAG: hypothetical protein A2Z15_03390 [Chloroflexi bacterium RBG_16_50_11]